jgi:hypothetical protein
VRAHSPDPSSSAASRQFGMPPGFSGDSLRASSVSAPPPGFHGSQAQQKQQRDAAAAAILGHPWETNNAGNGNNPFQLDAGSAGISLTGLRLEGSGNFLDSSSNGAHRNATGGAVPDAGERSSSFSNLSRVLGESMAQSMDESVKISLRKDST